MENPLKNLLVTITLLLGPLYISSASELTLQQRKEVVSSLSDYLQQYYVDKSYVEQLNRELRSFVNRNGAKLMSHEQFLASINSTLHSVTNDKHLALISPEKYEELSEEFGLDNKSDHKPQEKTKGHHQPNAQHHGNQGHNSDPRKNGLAAVGVRRVSEMSRDGLNQIGYIDFERLIGSQRSLNFLNKVFSSFTESDALVIDLRHCKGGDSQAVDAIVSYLVANKTHYLTSETIDRNTLQKTSFERVATPTSISGSLSNKPLFVLISEQTFSAAESLAFGLQSIGRAEVWGETSGGGGYMNDFFSLPHGFGASISIGRTISPTTGKGWQGVGVVPDKFVEKDHALIKALKNIGNKSNRYQAMTKAQQAIYHLLIAYADAWYQADVSTFSNILTSDFHGVVGDRQKQFRKADLVEDVKAGSGVPKDPIYSNRIVRDINIEGKQATATLILRKDIRQLSLVNRKGTWQIAKEVRTSKRIG